MNNLKLIENDLVPVYITDSGEKVVNGRELHEILKSRQDFSTWVKKRLNECDAKENKDYELNHNFVEQVSGTKHRIDYTILLDTAKEMAMLERNAKGKQVRRYFIKVDEKYKEEKSTPLTLKQQVQTIAKGTAELYERVEQVTAEVGNVKTEIEALRDELPLFPSEADKIKNAVNRKVVYLLGGKKSNAYKNNSLRQKLFSNCYNNLKGNFDVGKYTEIKRKYRKDALKIVEKYEAPYFLAEQIQMENAQMVFDLKGGAV